MKLASSTKYQIIPAIPVQRIVHPRRYYQIVMVLKLIPLQIKKVRKGLKMIPMALNGIVTINIIVTRLKTSPPTHIKIAKIIEPNHCNCEGMMFQMNMNGDCSTYGIKKKKIALKKNLQGVQNHGIQVKGQ